MYKKINPFFNSIYLFFRRIFNISNISKIIFIFAIGLISRIFLNNILYIYYIFFLPLIILISDFINYFNVNILPTYFFNSKVFNLNFVDFKISSIKRLIKGFYFNDLIKDKMVIPSNNEKSSLFINEMKPSKEIKSKGGYKSVPIE
jgi:hypothetical protein